MTTTKTSSQATNNQEVDVVAIYNSLSIKNNEVLVSSLDVAKTFGKQHYRVVRAIENLECSKGFSHANFGVANYKDSQGKMRKSYQMSFNGFTFLAMGFTGKLAAEFKEAYINAFNKAHEQLDKQYRKELEDQYRFKLVPEDERLSEYLIQEVHSLDDAIQGMRNLLLMTADRKTGFRRNTRITNFKAVISQLKLMIKQVNLIIKADFDGDEVSYINIAE